MRVRHRTPSIFSISMVDVLCCALGCMILMWLTSSQSGEATGKELALVQNEAKDLGFRLARTQDSERRLQELLAKLGEDGKTARKTIAELEAKALTLGQKKSAVDRLLEQRLKEIEDLEKRLGSLTKENTNLVESARSRAAESLSAKRRADDLDRRADDLVRKLKAAEAVIAKLEEAAKVIPNLRDELRDARADLAGEEKTSKLLKDDLAKRLADLAEAARRYEALRKAKLAVELKLDDKSKALLDATVYKDKLDDAEKARERLEKLLSARALELRDAVQSVSRLEGDKRKLRDEADRARAAVEERFAGIALKGRRVVFLIDLSGSMDLVDEKTPAPTKWPEVRATVVKLMKSLPELEKFQVIGFAEDVRFVLGKEGEWIDYDPKTSPDRVLEALARVKPKDGTDMHKGLGAAFAYRARGLDTIYFFSDGLPNTGDGLTPQQQAAVRDETQRAHLLGLYVRRKVQTDWNRALPGRERVRINSVGFFFESPDLGAFLWALARENDGSFVGMSKP